MNSIKLFLGVLQGFYPFEQGEVKTCKWGSGLLKSRLCFLTSKKHKQDYKQCHRQLLPQTRFLESFLEYVHSFRYQALRPTFTGPVSLRGSSGVLG